MTATSPTSADREARLVQVLDAYLAALHEGTPADPAELLARYPDLADDLRECLASLEFIRRAEVQPEQWSAGGLVSSEGGSPARLLGDFRILREVGRGGMGVVYEAEQVSLGRRVALKVLPFAATMDPRHLQRFHNEAQAAACLHHTNIVPVYFVGCERSVHFYAMQFIDGQPLSEVIRTLGQGENQGSVVGSEQITAGLRPPDAMIAAHPTIQAAIDATSLTVEGRRSRDYFRKVAELGMQAAEALDHAHQLGIVHRDIKPSNLLLDVRGNLWVTDFGLAQVLSDTRLTITGDVVGTLRYMSPEQALAQRAVIDHRTDIYSLGATLYELLTLQPAFGGEERQELLQQITFEEPSPPRRLDKAIPGELEIIILKMMEKEPAERYATAKEVAEDLLHWLEDKPIRARPPSVAKRLGKWARRHRGVVTTAVLLLAAIALTLAVSTVVIWHLQQQTVQAYAAELAQRERAEKQRQLARQAVNDMYTQVADKWLSNQPRLTEVEAEFLAKAARYYEDFAQEEEADPEVWIEAAQAYARVGLIQQRLGNYKEAEKAYRHQIALREKLATDVPSDPKYRHALINAHNNLANVLEDLGRHSEAEGEFRLVVQLQEELVAAYPSVSSYRKHLGGYYNNLGEILRGAGRPREAEEAYRQAIKAWSEVTELPAEKVDGQRVLVLAWVNLANLLNDVGRYQEAESLCQQAVSIARKSADEFPHPHKQEDSHRLAKALDSWGEALCNLRLLEGAQQALREALALREKLAADFPSIVEYQRRRALCQARLAEVLAFSGRYQDSEKYLRLGIATYERLAKAVPGRSDYQFEMTCCQNQLGDLLTRTDRPQEAEKVYRNVLAQREKLVRDHPTVPIYLAYLAEFLIACPDPRLRNAARAVELAKQAIRCAPEVRGYKSLLGQAYYRTGRYKEALEALEEGAKAPKRDKDIDDFYLAMTNWQLGAKQQARECYAQAVRQMDKKRPSDNDVNRIRCEAAALLGIEEKSTKEKEVSPEKK